MREFESLQCYLPSLVTNSVATKAKRNADGSLRKPPLEEIETVCLFADVAGFTALTEELCARGPNGMEDLSKNLNKFATQLVKLTTRAGGDILKFAGDAMMACWPEVDPKDPQDLQLRVQRAVQCALDIQKTLDQFEFVVYEKDAEFRNIESDMGDKRTLRCKLGLGIGRLRILHLGGNEDLIQRERFEYVAFGPALSEAIQSESFAQPGQVWISQAMWKLVGHNFTVPQRSSKKNKPGSGHGAEMLGLKGKKLGIKKLSKAGKKKDAAASAAAAADLRKLPAVEVDGWKEENRVPWRTFPRDLSSNDGDLERKMWKYVPNAVMPYLVETNDETWAPELRTVTTLFFNLGFNVAELSSGQHARELELTLEHVFFEIQNILLGYEGTINKFLIDDKGSTLIAVFGLPPIAHDNDPLRAILSALKVLWMLNRYKLQGSVGIATGLAFCGIIGHAAGNRREYSVIGDTVNLAARLMAAANGPGGALLLDSPTKLAASSDSFGVLNFIQKTISVKGKKEPVLCYQIESSNNRIKNRTHTVDDIHSVQLSQLHRLSKARNRDILHHESKDSRGNRRYQKTRRRGTLTPVTNPDDMKMIEEDQIMAMSSLNGSDFKAAGNTSVTSGGAGPGPSRLGSMPGRSIGGSETNGRHDTNLAIATKGFLDHTKAAALRRKSRRSSSRRDSAKRRSVHGAITLAKFTFRSPRSIATSPSARNRDGANAHRDLTAAAADEIVSTVVVGNDMSIVLDLLEGVVANLIKKGFLEEQYASELGYFELTLVENEFRRVPLALGRDIDSFVDRNSFAARNVISLELVQHETARAIDFNPVTGRPTSGRRLSTSSAVLDAASIASASARQSAGYVSSRLSQAIDRVLGGGSGGRFVLLSGERGVGKTYLIESCLEDKINDSTEALVCFARGNPFEIGRNARPFSTWETLLNCCLAEAEPIDSRPIATSSSSSSSSSRSRNTARGEAYSSKSREKAVSSAAISQALARREQILDALLLAKAVRPDKDINESDLHELNGILKTDFEHLEETLEETKSKGSSSKGKKKKDPKMSFNMGTSSRVKKLTQMFSSTSSANETHDDSASGSGSGSGLQIPPPMPPRRPSAAKVLERQNSLQDLHTKVATDGRLSFDPRTRKVVDLLAAIVAGLASKAPIALVVDEAHYMDTFSWLVFQTLAQEWMSENIFVALVNRTIHAHRANGAVSGEEKSVADQSRRVSFVRFDQSSKLQSHLDASSSSQGHEAYLLVHDRLKLLPTVEPLELHAKPKDTAELLHSFLGVVAAPPALERWLEKKSGGNPLFIQSSIRSLVKAGLVKHTGRDAFFPSGEGGVPRFEQLHKSGKLPVPLKVEAIAGAEIDQLNLTQVVIIKVAAVVGETFSLDIVRTVFPLRAQAEMVDFEFRQLEARGLIVRKDADDVEQHFQAVDQDKTPYRFANGWMGDILRKRMLNAQKLKLYTEVKKVRSRRDEEVRKRFLEAAQAAPEKPDASFSGFLYVKKGKQKSLTKAWKPRWCVLKGNELIQYHDAKEEKRLEVVFLSSQTSIVAEPVGAYVADASWPDPRPDAIYCITIQTTSWEKQGDVRLEPHRFVLAAATEAERQCWINRIEYQKVLEPQHGALPVPASPPSTARPERSDSGNSDMGISSLGHALSVAAGSAVASAAHLGRSMSPRASSASTESSVTSSSNSSRFSMSRPSVSTIASPEASKSFPPNKSKGLAKKGSALVMGALRGKKKDSGDGRGSTGTATSECGSEVHHMLPEDFSAIAAPESLAELWSSQENLVSRGQLPPTLPDHSEELFTATAEMSFVSRNSSHEIDGYLLGKLDRSHSGTTVGLIIAAAVLPQSRRQGIGRRLYQNMFALCRGQGVKVVRVAIQRESKTEMAFHRALKFRPIKNRGTASKEIPAELMWLEKDLTAATNSGDFEAHVECVNPMFFKRAATHGP